MTVLVVGETAIGATFRAFDSILAAIPTVTVFEWIRHRLTTEGTLNSRPTRRDLRQVAKAFKIQSSSDIVALFCVNQVMYSTVYPDLTVIKNFATFHPLNNIANRAEDFQNRCTLIRSVLKKLQFLFVGKYCPAGSRSSWNPERTLMWKLLNKSAYTYTATKLSKISNLPSGIGVTSPGRD